MHSSSDSLDDAVEELREMLKETVLKEGKASDLGESEDMKEFYTIKEPLIGKRVLKQYLLVESVTVRFYCS